MTGSRQTVEVNGAPPYRIEIGTDLLNDASLLANTRRGRHALIISDANVAPLYAARVEQVLQQADSRLISQTLILPAGETSKTLASFSLCIDALAALGAPRDACVYALGGGVIGDLAGFAAACWMRGIDCVQLPTSLLAMVDSAVGGKTAIDIAAGKNLVGAFHTPCAVVADIATLNTLPHRELRAGLAEVAKYGAIMDAEFLYWIDAHAQCLLAREPQATAHAIARSCAHKAAIVARDPFERGERALLNFGHTFAHAIEAEQGFDGLNHGEAVAVGMVLAARLSARLGMSDPAASAYLRALLRALQLPVDLPHGLDAQRLLQRMRLDKKTTVDGLRFVLWHGVGQACVVSSVAEAEVLAVLDSR